ncbi:MAG: amino acid adenylation domain-containing protein [Anaerolineaceae bacterium]|nr:amino acid adenylation domain-containing protein [Anaerolineaceae bacterium]
MDELKKKLDKMLNQQIQNGITKTGLRQTIPQAPILDAYPLSYSQERFWIRDQQSVTNPIHIIHKIYSLHGKLDFSALEKSYNQIIRRHETFRTIFTFRGGKPKQIILPLNPISIQRFDLRNVDKLDRQKEVEEIISGLSAPFILSVAPPFRIGLIQQSEKEHLLVVILHHIMFDGLSSRIFFNEVTSSYQSFASGNPYHAPMLPVQYKDFAYWHREYFHEDMFCPQIEYWKNQLGGELPSLSMPTDFSRPRQQTYNGDSRIIYLPKSLGTILKEISLSENGTLFMLLLTAYNILLSRYSGQLDIIVGIPISGRNWIEIENIIGVFINTLALRTDLSDNPTFRELFQRVREVCLNAFSHQDLPFEKIVEILTPPRSTSQQVIFQNMFQLRTWASKPIEVEGVRFEEVAHDGRITLVDLIMEITNRENVLECKLIFNTDLFKPETIECMLKNFHDLLIAVAENPDTSIERISLLSKPDVERILQDWNANTSNYPSDKCVHTIFEEQVHKTPTRIALVQNENSITYDSLNKKANQLANYLKKAGVSTNDIVGICVDQSFEMIIGLLAILKSGGAYLPIDITYPKDRMSIMMNDSRVPILLTQEKLLSILPETEAKIICLDSDWEKIVREKTDDIGNLNSSNERAYVIYTSGSTGTPKGVVIPHQAIIRLVKNTNYINIKSDDVFAQVSNFSFDAATFEIWGTLLNGSKLVIVPRDKLLSPTEFAQHLVFHQISILFLTTSLFNYYGSKKADAFKGIKYLLFGGEEANPEMTREVYAQSTPAHLINIYGPTENTSFSTWHQVKEIPEGISSIPIGKPISNTQTFILDAFMQPLPPGIPGELYLGGDGLALSYLNEPDLTAEKFIANIFSPASGSRLYRTGDLCKYTPNGEIIFLGRIDEQIKIRGFRIEPGEIESSLRKHPAIHDSIVIALKTDEGETRLVAYYVSEQAGEIDQQRIKSLLKESLPDFMIPYVYIKIPAIPFSPNGKINKKALPPPDWKMLHNENQYLHPTTETEKRLYQIWKEILAIEKISIDDNFFNLGGHSLLVVSLCINIEVELGVNLSFSDIYNAQTIRQQATMIEHRKVSLQPEGLIEEREVATENHKYLFWIGDGFWILQQHLADQPLFRLGHQGENGKRIKYTHIRDIAAHYLSIIKEQQPEGPYYLAGFSFGGVMAFEIAHLLRYEGDEVRLLFMLEPTRMNSKATKTIYADIQEQSDSNEDFRGKLSVHTSNLRNIAFKKWTGYIKNNIREQIKYRIIMKNKPVIDQIIMNIKCKSYLAIRKPIPSNLRSYYIITQYRKSLNNYSPQAYAGRAVFIEGENYEERIRGLQIDRLPVSE